MTCMEHAAYKLDGKIKPKGNMAEEVVVLNTMVDAKDMMWFQTFNVTVVFWWL